MNRPLSVTPSGESKSVVIAFDFDGTLLDGFMQEILFEKLGIDENRFWGSANKFAPHFARAYPHMTFEDDWFKATFLVQLAAEAHRRNPARPVLTNQLLQQVGKELQLRTGAVELFKQLKKDAQEMGVDLKLGILTNGYQEIVNGTELAPLCDFIYGHNFVPEINLLDPDGFDDLDMGNAQLVQPNSLVSRFDKVTLLRGVLDGTLSNPGRLGGHFAEESWLTPKAHTIYVSDQRDSDLAVIEWLMRQNGNLPPGFVVGIANSDTEFARLETQRQKGLVQIIADGDFSPEGALTVAGRVIRRQLATIGVRINRQADKIAARQGMKPAGHGVGGEKYISGATIDQLLVDTTADQQAARALVEKLASSGLPILLHPHTVKSIQEGKVPKTIDVYGIKGPEQEHVEAIVNALLQTPVLESSPTTGSVSSLKVNFRWLHPRGEVSLADFATQTVGTANVPVLESANGVSVRELVKARSTASVSSLVQVQ